MEAVYTLCNVDRGVPEVWGSIFDVRDLITAGVKMNAGKKIKDWPLGAAEKTAIMGALKFVHKTDIETLLIRLGAADPEDFKPLIEVDDEKVKTVKKKGAKIAKAAGAGGAVAAGIAAVGKLRKK